MNKKSVEALMDKLADKTLSFGCEVKTDEPIEKIGKIKVVYNEDTGDGIRLIIINEDGGEYYTYDEYVEILGHPVRIGDVLAKILNEQIKKHSFLTTLSYNDKRGNQVIAGKPQQIIDAWGKCGFTKSLQEIVEESGYKFVKTRRLEGCGDKKDPPCEAEYMLSCPNARALLEFLNERLNAN